MKEVKSRMIWMIAFDEGCHANKVYLIVDNVNMDI